MEEEEKTLHDALMEFEETFIEVKAMSEEKNIEVTKKKRSSKEELLDKLKEEEKKLDAEYARKKEKFEEKKKRLTLTPEERKAEKNRAETHAKIIAGVTALELAEMGPEYFKIEKFKKTLFKELTKPLEIKFLKIYFPD